MKRLEEIRNEVAKERGYRDWETLNGSDLYDSDIDKVAIKYAEECIKASLEKASENAGAYKLDYPNNVSKAVVEKETITNPENIILL